MHTHASQHTHTEHTHTPKENSENLHMLYLYAFPVRAPYSDKFYKSITFYWDVRIAVCLWGGHSTLLRTGGLNSFLPLGCGETTLSILLGSGESNSDGSSLRPWFTHNSTSDFPLELRSLLINPWSQKQDSRAHKVIANCENVVLGFFFCLFNIFLLLRLNLLKSIAHLVLFGVVNKNINQPTFWIKSFLSLSNNNHGA